jgi:hypothetical protein
LNSARIPPPQQASGDRAGGEELQPGGEAPVSVPAADPVGGKELPATGLRERQDVLEVRSAGCGGADHGGVERSARRREEPEEREPRGDLEAA